MSLSPIIFYLQKTGSQDDVLKITPSPYDSGFDLEFKQRTIGTVSKGYVEQCDITSYIYRFFLAIAMDQVSCEYVQIDCPTYPSLIRRPATLDQYFPILREQILGLLKGWPVEKKLSQNKSGVKRNVLFAGSDSSGSSVEEPKD